MADRMREIWEFAPENIRKAQARQSEFANRHRKDVVFNEGDSVWAVDQKSEDREAEQEARPQDDWAIQGPPRPQKRVYARPTGTYGHQSDVPCFLTMQGPRGPLTGPTPRAAATD
jgi:hypothetical protein